MDSFNIDHDENNENDNIMINDENEVITNHKNNMWENIINQLGLNININYPVKTIENGIYEIHCQRLNTNTSKYTKNIKFKDDKISKTIETHIFGQHSYAPYNLKQFHRSLNNLYRHHKYDNIVNIIDKNDNKKDVLGFNYKNPRWEPLNREYI